jgi:GNAT superfamily N-acetyltransferase
MNADIRIRAIERADYPAWQPLWAGYNAFYGRQGPTALPAPITATTWQRLLDPAEAMYALVAEQRGLLLGLAHYLFHRSTTRAQDVCYLQDLYTLPPARGQGIGRALIGAVYAAARAAGSTRVYWQTQQANAAARALYEQLAEHHGFIIYTHEL